MFPHTATLLVTLAHWHTLLSYLSPCIISNTHKKAHENSTLWNSCYFECVLNSYGNRIRWFADDSMMWPFVQWRKLSTKQMSWFSSHQQQLLDFVEGVAIVSFSLWLPKLPTKKRISFNSFYHQHQMSYVNLWAYWRWTDYLSIDLPEFFLFCSNAHGEFWFLSWEYDVLIEMKSKLNANLNKKTNEKQKCWLKNLSLMDNSLIAITQKKNQNERWWCEQKSISLSFRYSNVKNVDLNIAISFWLTNR